MRMFYTAIPVGLGLLGLIFLILSLRVVRLRSDLMIELGDGGNEELRRAIRAHGNFVEYVPICLILILVAQGMAVSGWIILVAIIALVLGRALHAIGLSGNAGPSPGRLVGTLLTWFVLAGMSVVLLVYAALRVW